MDVVLIVIDLFVAFTAIGGGLAMAFGIDKRVDPAWLEGTPFSNYRAPGFALAGLVGGSALLGAIMSILDGTIGAGLSATAGGVLCVWIAVEVRILNQPVAPTNAERFYFALGVSMLALGLVLAID